MSRPSRHGRNYSVVVPARFSPHLFPIEESHQKVEISQNYPRQRQKVVQLFFRYTLCENRLRYIVNRGRNSGDRDKRVLAELAGVSFSGPQSRLKPSQNVCSPFVEQRRADCTRDIRTQETKPSARFTVSYNTHLSSLRSSCFQNRPYCLRRGSYSRSDL